MDLTESISTKDAKKLAKASVLSTSNDPKKQDRARARKVEVDYKDLLRQIKARKRIRKESFEIDKSAHRKAQREKKIRDRTKTGDEGSKIAQTKVKGPKLYGEEDNFSQKDKELKRTKSARNQRYNTLHSGTNTSKNTDVNEGKSWKDFKQAMKSAVKKKNAPKHDYGRDAGAEAKKRLKKKDHETVNFLDPDD